MGAVDEGRDAAFAGGGAEVGHRHRQRGGRGDVAQGDEPRARRHRRHQALHDLATLERQRDLHATILRTALRTHLPPGRFTGTVLVVGGHHLVTRLQRKRPRHDVDTRGRVRHEDEFIGPGTQRPAQCGARLHQQFGGTAAEEGHRVVFHLLLPSALCIEHFPGAGTEGPVVQEGQPRVEQKEIPHATAAQRGAKACVRSASGAASGQVGTPSARVSHGCLRLTQMWAAISSSSLRSSVPARTITAPGRPLLVL